MKIRTLVAGMLCLMLLAGMASAQKAQTSDVHLFQNFFRDAVIASTPYGEGGLQYGSYDGLSTLAIGVQGGYPIDPKLEMGVGLNFLSYSYDGADSQSGISDRFVSGRYILKPGPTQMTAGAYLTLPIGSDEVGQGTTDFGLFGATRHKLDNKMTITGTVGIDFIEFKTTSYDIDWETGETEEKEESDRETSIVIGGGLIYTVDKALDIVGELVMKTEVDYMMLSGAVNYQMGNGHLRGGLGLGLDDGAPDLLIMGSYLMAF